MSDFHALAAVSTSLRTLLLDRMEPAPGFDASKLLVTVSTPRAEGSGGGTVPETPRVNLFLYRVTRNEFITNEDPRSSAGAYGIPPLGLDLHYLLTGYGATGEEPASANETPAQDLLGSAMGVLNDHPVLTPAVLTVREPAGTPVLDPGLLDAAIRLKLALDPLTLEDLTKVWTALAIPYRLSAAYQVSAVQIDSHRTPRLPQLVGEPPAAGPRILVSTLSVPSISALAVRRAGDPVGTTRAAAHARIGDTLLIHGTNLAAARVSVRIGNAVLPVDAAGPTRIELVLPDEAHVHDGETTTLPPARRLQPGITAVEVTTSTTATPGAGATSNRTAFMLTPGIDAITGTAPRTLTITGSRLTAPPAPAETLVGPARYPATGYATATPTRIGIELDDGLPHRTATAYLSDPLPAYTPPDEPPTIEATVGGAAATVSLPRIPADHAALAADLQGALRAADAPAFAGIRVCLAGDRMVLLPAGLQSTITLAGPDAAALGLAAGSRRTGWLSGPLDLDAGSGGGSGGGSGAAAGELQATRAGAAAVVHMPGPAQATVAGAATALQDALHDAAPSFATLLVAAAGGQLLVLDTAADVALDFGPTPADAATVARLGLKVRYPVRVRVNGAEAVDGPHTVELPL